MVKRFVGNFKSIVKNNFIRVMAKRIRRLLGARDVYGKCRPVYFVIKLLLGPKQNGDGDDDDDDDNPDDEEEGDSNSVNELEEYTIQDFFADIKAVKKKSKAENEMVALLMSYSGAATMRQTFLPEYLQEFVGDSAKGWGKKLYSDPDFVSRIVKLFAEENMAIVVDEASGESTVKFVQQISPQPKFSARYTEFTTTNLADMWCKYLKRNREIHVDPEECRFISQIMNCKINLYFTQSLICRETKMANFQPI
jgi:hypothetical protein